MIKKFFTYIIVKFHYMLWAIKHPKQYYEWKKLPKK